MMDNKILAGEINKLKKQRRAVVLAHLYQAEEVQEIADFTGDSLELSRAAAATDAEVIVFCGVRFMAETAKMLSPSKTVLLPVMDAACPLADMITSADVARLKAANPGAAVVCYINSPAEVKAVSDYCCTSSNAVSIVRNIPEQEVIFVPDANLGRFAALHAPEKRVVLWDGCCPVHQTIAEKDADAARREHPRALVLAHPECRPEVLAKADFVGSTSGILQYARDSVARHYIIGTEMGILYRLRQENPAKDFYLLSPRLVCSDMKKTRLEDVYNVLWTMGNQIEVDGDTRRKAVAALNRMLGFS